jgi:hypothetical protein
MTELMQRVNTGTETVFRMSSVSRKFAKELLAFSEEIIQLILGEK